MARGEKDEDKEEVKVEIIDEAHQIDEPPLLRKRKREKWRGGREKHTQKKREE